MIPLPVSWAAFKALPWKNIITLVAICGAIIAVVMAGRAVVGYIAKAEADKAAVIGLTEANKTLQADLKKSVEVLQAAMVKEREREKRYGENNKKLGALPDSGCARNSAPIVESIRMRRQAAAGNER